MTTLDQFARTHLGKPWRDGARGPDEFDCVGLVYACAKEVGIDYPMLSYSRHTPPNILLREISPRMRRVSLAEVQPGDVLVVERNMISYVQIVSAVDPLTVIHAHPTFGVVERKIEPQARIRGIFRP